MWCFLVDACGRIWLICVLYEGKYHVQCNLFFDPGKGETKILPVVATLPPSLLP